jgi:hypothetical protein
VWLDIVRRALLLRFGRLISSLCEFQETSRFHANCCGSALRRVSLRAVLHARLNHLSGGKGVDPVPPQIQDSEVLKISTSEGNVEALFLPAIAGADAVSKPVVIFGHGNGEVIDYWITPFHGFRERGTPEPPRQQRPHARLEQSEPKSALLSFVKS